MLRTLGRVLRPAVFEERWHSNVYGVARSLLAIGTLGTLLATHASSIFRPAVGLPRYPLCNATSRFGLFCLAGPDHLELARWLAIAGLAVVASGWRPRFTSLPHWYISWSFFTSGLLVDGGDQITANLALLLLPVALSDGRRLHWLGATSPPPGAEDHVPSAAMWIAARSFLVVIRLQIAGLYLQAAVSKMRVAEWRDGTAVYYWFTDPGFGLWEPIRTWAMPLLANGQVVAALTWSAMGIETFLFAGLIATPTARRVLLMFGILFHAAIALVHGLPSFAFAMWAGLILFLRPPGEEFRLPKILWPRRWISAYPMIFTRRSA
jgi:antimicrobial peptide system SdpB family protein